LGDGSVEKWIYGQQTTVAGNWRSMFQKYCPTGSIVGLSPTGNALVTDLNAKLSLPSLGYVVQEFASDD
jgi:hypothetical protein